MPTTPRANSELVAVAWLASAAGISPGQVATTVPADPRLWAANGFVQVSPVVGGSPNVDNALRKPVLQIETWAATPDSGKPPWGKAASLFELLMAATYDDALMQRTLTLPAGYPQARVLTALFLTEPRRTPADESSYARFTADLALHWISL
ncbi:hypothetical protein ACFWPV_09820 [Streptomyces uncialis]|uniref:hypothetical protein n=1 Tax=Streptomyces uncialis TaxID=1048205 RepID=UPI0036689D88